MYNDVARTVSLVLLMAIGCLGCSAHSTPIPFPMVEAGWEAPVKSRLSDEHRNVGSIYLGRTSFNEVQNMYGRSIIAESYGGKSYSPNLICYGSPYSDSLLVFQTGPLGGWSIVTGVLLVGEPKIVGLACHKQGSLELPKAIAGIALGVHKSNVLDSFGDPSVDTDELLAYRFEDSGRTNKASVSATVTSGMEFGLEEDRVAWVRVYWQEST